VSDLRGKLTALETEQQTARQVAEQAEAAWRSALADDRLGEGGKAAITKARAALDAARESVIAVEGAVAEIGRRLSAAEAELLAARLAALVARADKGAGELGRCVTELLELDAAAGQIRDRMRLLAADLMQAREEHRDLDPEGRSPGELPDLARMLFDGVARAQVGAGLGHLALAHIELAGFASNWRQGLGRRPERMLGD
jgi:hypothetical protein